MLSSEISIVYGTEKKCALYALVTAVNAAMAAGAGKVKARVRVEYPEGIEKARIYGMMKPIRAFCRAEGISLVEDGIWPSPAVGRTATIAVAESSGTIVHNPEAPGQDILLTGWVGLGGTLLACWEKEKELEKRFPPGFLHQIVSLEGRLYTGKEAALAWESGAGCVRAVADGGIYAGLWKLAKESGCGLDIDLKKLPIRQETVEVCEYLGLNPYQFSATGCLLITVDHGDAMKKKLMEQGIPTAVVGRLTEGRDKILRTGEEIRYLDRPAPDEMRRICC